MTGGIIPLAVTLAKNAVFDTFIGDSKLKALLHGHSYSAHAMGCAAGIKSIQWFKDPCSNPLTSLLKEDYLGRCPSSPAVIHERIQRFSNMLAEHQATGSAVLPVHQKAKRTEIAQRRIRRPFSVTEVEALVQAVEKLGTGRRRDVKLRAFDNAKHQTYVDLKYALTFRAVDAESLTCLMVIEYLWGF
ncbi:Telomere repeat-binding protein 3 [Glycine soja]